jgi:hypothetical protein
LIGLANIPNPNRDWRVDLDNGESFFLVPLPRRNWKEPRGLKVDGRAFPKRALFHHRIISTVIDGAAVEFAPINALRAETDAVGFGTALFPNVVFQDEGIDEEFLVTDVAFDDGAAIIETAVANSYDRRCTALVFPELTIDETNYGLIGDLLQKKSIQKAGGVQASNCRGRRKLAYWRR